MYNKANYTAGESSIDHFVGRRVRKQERREDANRAGDNIAGRCTAAHGWEKDCRWKCLRSRTVNKSGCANGREAEWHWQSRGARFLINFNMSWWWWFSLDSHLENIIANSLTDHLLLRVQLVFVLNLVRIYFIQLSTELIWQFNWLRMVMTMKLCGSSLAIPRILLLCTM